MCLSQQIKTRIDLDDLFLPLAQLRAWLLEEAQQKWGDIFQAPRLPKDTLLGIRSAI